MVCVCEGGGGGGEGGAGWRGGVGEGNYKGVCVRGPFLVCV